MTYTKLLLGFTAAILVISFTLYGFLSLDHDFGWHLRMGQLILDSGIPKTDPFSYTMPSFPFIDHEWLTNVIFFKLYSFIGKLGLSFIFALLTITSLIITIPRKLLAFAFVPILLSSTILMSSLGIRPQIETWVLFALLFRILTDQKFFRLGKFFIPILMLVWVNLHGAFALGIVVLLLFNTVSIWQSGKVNLTNLTILILSILATFLNPYGLRIWKEVWMQMTDTNLRWSILEWYPLILRLDLAFLILLSLSLVFIWKYKKSFSLFEKSLYFGLLLAGLSSQRHISLWLIITTPLFTKSLSLAFEEFTKEKLQKERFIKAYKLLLLLAVLIFSFHLFLVFQTNFTEEKYYPKQAISFLKTLPLDYQILAPYDWGGYLIWNLPDRKVFIDGRMPSWKEKQPKNQETSWAFKTYTNAVNGKELEETVDQFNIRYILWRLPTKESIWKIKLSEVFGDLYYQISINNHAEEFIDRLEGLGWKRIYQDQVSVIYQKPQ